MGTEWNDHLFIFQYAFYKVFSRQVVEVIGEEREKLRWAKADVAIEQIVAELHLRATA